MASIDLLDKRSEWPRYFRQIISDIRTQSITEGIDPVDFPKYLKEQGIEADGRFIIVDDALLSFYQLKFYKHA